MSKTPLQQRKDFIQQLNNHFPNTFFLIQDYKVFVSIMLLNSSTSCPIPQEERNKLSKEFLNSLLPNEYFFSTFLFTSASFFPEKEGESLKPPPNGIVLQIEPMSIEEKENREEEKQYDEEYEEYEDISEESDKEEQNQELEDKREKEKK